MYSTTTSRRFAPKLGLSAADPPCRPQALMMLAVTAGAFLLATWGRDREIVLLPPGVSRPLKATVEVFAGLPLPFFLFRDLKESPSSRQQWPPRTQLANRGRLA
jgi:hypothetical protein